MKKMTKEMQEIALRAIRANGTIKSGADAAGVTNYVISNEIKHSKSFKKKVDDALIQGKSGIGDLAVDEIRKIAFEHNDPKQLKHKLIALLALANANVPGFKGTSKVEGRIEHDVQVTTGVPRPRYIEPVIEVTPIEEGDKLKQLNAGKPIRGINAKRKTKERSIKNAP